jgi:hypothetical protein
MNAFLIQSRCVFRSIVFALSTLSIPSLTFAAPPDSLPEDACQLRWQEEETEWCGWTPLATHDSVAYRPPAPAREPASESDTTVDGSITQGAAIAFASAGISVEQLLEPLALVTPYLDNSLEKVRQYQSWWGAAIATATRIQQAEQTAPADPTVAQQLSRIATEKPIDTECYGPSVVVDAFPVTVQLIPEGEPGIEILPLDRRVGGSAIIATIEEAYLPYDVLPTSTHPFCIHAEGDIWDAAVMWQTFDEHVATDSVEDAADAFASEEAVVDVAIVEPVVDHCGFADCVLESLIWNTENWIAEHEELWASVEANNVGRQVAQFGLRRHEIVQIVANQIAIRWQTIPAVEVEQPSQEISATGAALLARAGAVAASEPVVEMAAIEMAAAVNALR